MKNPINRALFLFELRQLFCTKQGLGQSAFMLAVLWHSSSGAAKGLYANSPDYWSNFILINGFCLALVINLLAGSELFYKPKKEGALEALLASGLRPDTVAATNAAVSAVYNAAMLAALLLLLAFTLGRFSFAPVHLLSFLAVTLANGALLVVMSFLSLQTKYGMHAAGFMLLLGVNLMLAASMTGFSLDASAGLQGGFAAASALLLGASLRVYRLFDREKVLLS